MESFDLIVLTSVNGLAAMWFYISSLFLCIFFFCLSQIAFSAFLTLQTPSTPTGTPGPFFSFLPAPTLLTGYIDTLTTLCEAKSFFHFQPL